MARIRAVDHDALGQLLPPSGEAWQSGEDQVEFHYIEIGSVGIGSDSYEAVRLRVADAPSRARQVVHSGDILVSMTRPDRGAIARVKPEHDGYIASTGFAVLSPTIPSQRDILFETLQTEVVRLQLRQRSTGGAYPAITAEELARIQIPLTGEASSTSLLSGLTAARVARDDVLKAADDLLAGTDAFVLAALGLRLSPPHDPTKPFAVNLQEIQRNRADADYFMPRFKELRAQIAASTFAVKPLREICEPLRSGFAAGADDQADEATGVPHIRPTNISGFGEIIEAGMKYVPRTAAQGDLLQPGEVLFNNTNSPAWVGKSAVFDRTDDCACSNHITRLRLREKGDDPSYLAALLNALRSLGYFSVLATNFNNQAGINTDVLGALPVPMPAPPKQKDIATEVNRRRAESRRLRAEARADWAAARRRFEDALLGTVA